MAVAGLRVRDADNTVLLDTTTRLGTILGVVGIGQADGFVENPDLMLGRPFWSCTSLEARYVVRQPKIEWSEVNGVRRISWSWSNPGSQFNNPCRLIYGVF